VPGGCRVASLGHHLPDTVVTTEEIAERLGVEVEWILTRTGIRQRRLADKTETVVDMATAAAAHALANLAVDAEIDTVIVATSTAETTIPSVAAQVGSRVGLRRPAAFDVNTACAGFCYSLGLADSLIRSGASRGALVVGADKATNWLDWDDRDTAILFGDGAGAAVVLPDERRRVGEVLWGSEGDQADLIGIHPEERVLRQNGRAVFRWASGLGPIARQICARSGVLAPDLAAFVPHQANLRIIDNLAKYLNLGEVPIARDVVDCGNTIAATIPIALSRMVERNELPDGGAVLLFGFGAGLAYAGQVVTLDPTPVPANSEAAKESVGCE
jgi:3-oxoacyl-[acyl-carrier-protein] synthase-3